MQVRYENPTSDGASDGASEGPLRPQELDRLREEAEKGHKTLQAAKEGFANALSAIVDGNVTTLLTALILYNVGTGRKTTIKELAELVLEITGADVEIQYEPAGKLSRQCSGRKLLPAAQAGADQAPHLPGSQDSAGRYLRLHRDVLQSAAQAWLQWHALAG